MFIRFFGVEKHDFDGLKITKNFLTLLYYLKSHIRLVSFMSRNREVSEIWLYDVFDFPLWELSNGIIFVDVAFTYQELTF